MMQGKFTDYTQKMSAYELNRLLKYIHSPLFNDDANLKKLFDGLIPLIKAGKVYTENDAWVLVYGNKRFSRGRYNRLLSDAVKKTEHFLVVDRFQQQKTVQHIYQLEIMNERKLNTHIPEFMDFAFRKNEQGALRDAGFYSQQLQLQQQKNLFLENRDQRSVEKNLADVIESLDTLYLLQKLKYSAAVLHYKNFLALDSEMPLLKEVLQHLNQRAYNIPALQIYRSIILSFTEPENTLHYTTAKNLIVTQGRLFAITELKNMLVFVMNYCINRINFGQSEYLPEILQLYKYALQNDLLLEDGHLSQWDYKNIVTTALRVKDFKWVAGFLEEYKPRLPRADRQNAYTFNLARYYFAIKKYDQVLTLLQNVKYSDIFYQLDSKTTLLKTYFELGEWMPLYSLKDSFRVLLRRKKLITQGQKDNYMNLLRLTIRLFKADVKNRKLLNSLKDEIGATANVADKSWLMEKITELLPA